MLSAAILAGGRARRFDGRDKSALLVDGVTIRDRQIAELATFADEILVVGSDWGPSPLRPHSVPTPSPVRFVADRVPDCGPLGGLHTALLEAAGDVTIVIACDMPYVSAPALQYLATLTAGADAVVPRTERGYHPLCAAYTRACLEPAARHLASGQLKMSDLLNDLRVRVVDADELSRFGDVRRLLANVNTPADYREIDALQGHQL